MKSKNNVFCLDLDADWGQAGDGHLHRQKLPLGLQKPGHPRVQAGAPPLPSCSRRLQRQRTQSIHPSYFVPLKQVSNRGEAHLELNAFRRKHDCALVISGDSLEVLR